ncbi:alpha/beta hydrolase [Microbulbifer sp. SSSA007]|uniref:alpha/beta hydrolase n=1 Tax=Microbulbifer sp. SSSA007 TaxID=3243379 RepID=UPI00403A7A50
MPGRNNLCVNYFHATALINKKINYSIEVESYKSESTVNLKLNRNALESSFSGTVILLHGFRASKEFILSSALYFRFLGFDVVIPDLLGHGESGGKKAFGVGDSEIVNALVDNLIQKSIIKKDNLYLLGHSMGALTTARISASRQDISGLIPEKNFREGATRALEKANIYLDDTRIKALLISSNSSTLLFLSSSDPIAPYSEFKDLTDSNINLVLLRERNHPSMEVIGKNEYELLVNWLN